MVWSSLSDRDVLEICSSEDEGLLGVIAIFGLSSNCWASAMFLDYGVCMC